MVNATYPKPTGIEINGQLTTVTWSDGTKTISRPDGQDVYDPANGVLWALAKKFVEIDIIIQAVGIAVQENGG